MNPAIYETVGTSPKPPIPSALKIRNIFRIRDDIPRFIDRPKKPWYDLYGFAGQKAAGRKTIRFGGTAVELNKYLDHTLLKPASSKEDILKACEEAKRFSTASLCVNTCWTKLVHDTLAGSGVMTCVVVGFPLGAMAPAAKAEEARLAVLDGADEVDMVVNLGFVKSGDWDAVEQDIAGVVKASGSARVKVIIEACLLTDAEKVQACLAAKRAGAAFVKTSTGFSTGGATVEDVALMRKTVGADMGVKAAGGVRTKEQAYAMIEAGATRIGTSSAARIME